MHNVLHISLISHSFLCSAQLLVCLLRGGWCQPAWREQTRSFGARHQFSERLKPWLTSWAWGGPAPAVWRATRNLSFMTANAILEGHARAGGNLGNAERAAKSCQLRRGAHVAASDVRADRGNEPSAFVGSWVRLRMFRIDDPISRIP